MKKECPAIDAYINITECTECESKCDNEIILSDAEIIFSIFSVVCPGLTYVDTQQAYKLIMKKLDTYKNLK